NKLIGVNIGVFGIDRSSFPLLFNPWINVSMVNNNAIDYVNLMSYHSIDNIFPWNHSDASILPWIRDADIATKIWGLNRNKINLGISTYYYNKSSSEPLWCNLSQKCPNVDFNSTECEGIHIVSK